MGIEQDVSTNKILSDHRRRIAELEVRCECLEAHFRISASNAPRFTLSDAVEASLRAENEELKAETSRLRRQLDDLAAENNRLKSLLVELRATAHFQNLRSGLRDDINRELLPLTATSKNLHEITRYKDSAGAWNSRCSCGWQSDHRGNGINGPGELLFREEQAHMASAGINYK
jgi:cell division protein FtsB